MESRCFISTIDAQSSPAPSSRRYVWPPTVPGTRSSASHTQSQFSLTMFLRAGDTFYPSSTTEESKTQKGHICPGPHRREVAELGFTRGSLTLLNLLSQQCHSLSYRGDNGCVLETRIVPWCLGEGQCVVIAQAQELPGGMEVGPWGWRLSYRPTPTRT